MGRATGLCAGLAINAYPGEPVTLVPCGVSANTVWIALAADVVGQYMPLINATDTSVSAPEVLTVGVLIHGFPPSVSVLLEVAPLFQNDGSWSTSQMWGEETGGTGHILFP